MVAALRRIGPAHAERSGVQLRPIMVAAESIKNNQ
jgi:hypothetical protein